MQLAFLLFADAANMSAGGKLNMTGEFTALPAAQVPTVATFAIASRVYFEGAELGVTQRVETRLFSPDRTAVLARHIGPVPPAPPGRLGPDPEWRAITTLVEVRGLFLPVYGGYPVDVLVNDTLLGTGTLIIVPPERHSYYARQKVTNDAPPSGDAPLGPTSNVAVPPGASPGAG